MRKIIILLLALVTIVMAGCFGRGTPTTAPETREAQTDPMATQVPEAESPTNTPQPTNTPEPASTPSPTPTPMPEPTAASAESESSEESKVDAGGTVSSTISGLADVIWQWTELYNDERHVVRMS